VPLTSLITLEADVAQALQETVMTQGVDLIVMGARGHSTAAALLLGSLTEKLIWMTTVPLLVVKDKGERVGFLKIYSIARDAVVL
jgi:nucleotide-binding universal stress UspA family protein